MIHRRARSWRKKRPPETPAAADREADAPEAEATLEDGCVLEVPERRHVSIPSLEIPVRGRVARTCARIQREARARLPRDIPDGWRALEEWAAAWNTEEPGDPRDPPSERLRRFAGRFGRCVGAGEGAWVVAVEAADVDRDVREQPLRVRGRLTYVARDGSTRAGDGAFAYELDPPDERELYPLRLRPIHDYDGDGRVEVTLRTHEMNGRDTVLEREVLFTATEQGVRPVALPEGVAIDGWTDADADGRPDVVSRSPFRVRACFMDDPEGEPELIVHAGPGLQFSADDEVASAHAHRICPCRPTRLLALPSDDEPSPVFSTRTLIRVACARLFGTDAETIERRWRNETNALEGGGLYGDSDDACAYSLERLHDFIHTPPPLTLSP
ncbi:MAG: hypothetical protein M5U28_12150 [Sandaracinaceae bacterium]|nr:hypothetical protein [Sandaracinaceae bacterium]